MHLSLTGPAPRWARPKPSLRQAWYKPNAREFGKWAGVVAEHFAGRVDRYSIWNEPNWKTWLGPLKSAPALYRSLYTRGYAAIKDADPRAKVLIGETSPNGRAGLSTAPLAFLRKVACVNSKYKRVSHCPTLKADGYAHHPYDFRHAPNFQFPGDDNVTLGTLSRLTKALDKLSRVGALRKNGGGRMPALPDRVRLLRDRSPSAARQNAHALPAAGLLDRAEELPRQEPAAVPAGVAARELELGLLQPRAALDARQEVPAVRRPAALVQGEPREGEAARRGTRPPGRAAQPGSVSARLADARERLRRARLYLVVEAAAEPVLEPALRGGVDMVQLRDKHADDDTLLRAAARFRALCTEHGALFWVNDRPDLARAAEADGVHVGQDDEPVGAVREQVGPDLLIGLSTHSPRAVRRRARVGRRPAQRRPGLGDAHQGRAPGGRAGLRALRGREWCERAMVRDRRDRRG